MVFNYNKVSVASDSVSIADLGNVCLRVITTEEECYYLYIKTKNGKSSIIIYGPKECGENNLLSKVDYSYERVDYSLKKLTIVINSFINSPKNKQKVVNVQEIDPKEMSDDIIDFYKYTLSEVEVEDD